MNRTLTIADAGVNHNGSIEIARRLIDVAAEAGADFVKFQSFHASSIVSKDALQAEYQKKHLNGSKDDSQLSMLKELELSEQSHLVLLDYCKRKNISFLSTPFDLESICFLSTLHLGVWKIPSGEVTNYPYLIKIAHFNEPTILSTGMCSLSEIEASITVLIENGLDISNLTILHCNTEYPTPFEDVNLKAMLQIKEKFGVNVGYSDHTPGIEVPIAAVALGASVIEKHLTIDRSLPGPDHLASLEPDEFKMMVSAIRNIEKALGDGNKRVSISELKNRQVARKSIVASRMIHKGELFSESNLTVKRPGIGLSPMLWRTVVGKSAKRDFVEDELIEL